MKLKQSTIENVKRYCSGKSLAEIIKAAELFSEHLNEKPDGRIRINDFYFTIEDFEKDKESMIETNHDLGHAPKHYEQACAKIEPREFLKLLPFQLGNACKYLLRYQYKGHPVEDLKKALDYLEWASEDYEEPISEKVFVLAPYFNSEMLNMLFDTEDEEMLYDVAIEFVKQEIARLEAEDED